MTETRIDRRFKALKKKNRAGLVTYIMAGDPDFDTSLSLVRGLPKARADFIELGMPFTDPMADGPSIQAAAGRALASGQTMVRTLEMVRQFRAEDEATPIILMGYYNPIYSYGVDRFLSDAKDAGVDGFIIVDLPTEEDDEMCKPAMGMGLNFIRLVAPTTDEQRLPVVLANTSGFVYYISITGITGGRSATSSELEPAMARLKGQTDLPIAVGFGIKTPAQAAEVAKIADAAVVGTAIIDQIACGLGAGNKPSMTLVEDVLAFVSSIAEGIAEAR